MRIVLFSVVAFLCATQIAPAQQSGRRDHPIREPYITRSGETVDKPGEPQSSGTTELDRGIQREDNKIDSSLCKGC